MFRFGLVYWGLTPQQQPGSYQGGEMMMMKSVFWWRKPTAGVQSFRVKCLSGTFTPCRHLRPSSGREHMIVYLIQSSDDDYLMNETRRKPTTRRQSPSLFDKCHGIFYMPSRTDTAGHTKAFDSWGTRGKAEVISSTTIH